MGSASEDDQLLLDLGPFGQTAGHRLYTVTSLGFAVENQSDIAEAITVFERAANSISEIYPWLTGLVILEPPTAAQISQGSAGTLKVVRYPAHEGTGKFLHVKDCTSLCPDYAEILRLRAPASMLDGGILSPGYGYTNPYPVEEPMPAMIMQLSILSGGLVLTVCAQHNVMDGTANGLFIRQYSAMCRGIEPSAEQVEYGNANRNTIIAPMPADQELAPLTVLRRLDAANAPSDQSWPPAPVPVDVNPWKTFRFSRSSLAKLKSLAQNSFTPTTEIPYLTLNDALTAFVWTRLTAARLPHLPSSASTMLLRAVDGRPRLSPPLSNSYMGDLASAAITTVPVAFAADFPDNFSACVVKLRESLSEVNDLRFRSIWHIMKDSAPTSVVRFGPALDGDTDMVISSFVAQGLYDCDFGGVVGKPGFVRRPKLPYGGALCYLMPTTRDGDVDAVYSMTEREFEGLMEDSVWRDYAEFLG